MGKSIDCHFKSEKPQTEDKRLANFLVLLATMTILGLVYRGATIITPTYFELNTPKVLGLFNNLLNRELSANLIATISTAFIFLVGVIAQFMGGHLAEKFAPNLSWYIDVIIKLIEYAGDYVDEDLWFRVAQIVTGFSAGQNGESTAEGSITAADQTTEQLQSYAAFKMFDVPITFVS